MNIEDIDAFDSWLVRKLALLKKANSDIDALSRYVVALVRKNKSIEELNQLCVESLDYFFDGKTTQFVDIVFEGLRTKAYLKNDHEVDKLTPDSNTDSVSPPDIKPVLTSIKYKHKSTEEPAERQKGVVSSSISRTTTPAPRKKIKTEPPATLHENTYIQTAMDSLRRDSSSDIAFGFYIGAQLNELPNNYVKEKLKLEIQQLLANAQFPRL